MRGEHEAWIKQDQSVESSSRAKANANALREASEEIVLPGNQGNQGKHVQGRVLT
jgi:hypothetical protein